jgi:hypothetical protein
MVEVGLSTLGMKLFPKYKIYEELNATEFKCLFFCTASFGNVSCANIIFV